MMLNSRSLATIVALGTALMSTSTAFSPYSSTKLASSSRPQSLLHVGTTLPTQPGQFGSGFDEEEQHHGNHALPSGVHAPITAIHSPQELADFLHKDDRICVIKFHAAWCKSCQRFGLKFQGLANDKTDWIADDDHSLAKEGPMRFASIEFGANSGMCRTLGIKRLPTVQVFQKGQKIDGFACGPAKFPMLVEKVEQYLQAQSFEEVMQQGDELMSSSQVTAVLQNLIEQDANGILVSGKTQGKNNKSNGNNKKSWWNIMP